MITLNRIAFALALKPCKPSVQTDATLLANNSQHCWMLHVSSVCTPCCMLLRVVARSLAQQCWELLRPFARSLRADSSSCRHEKLFGIVWTEAYRR